MIKNEPNDFTQRERYQVDTGADTMCAGAMFKSIETTGELCDTTGLHPDLPPIEP